MARSIHEKDNTNAYEQRPIPVPKEIRDEIRELKGDRSYRELLEEWIDRYAAEKRTRHHE